jgi:hypothetical protein
VSMSDMFMELVQSHERSWGMEQYQNRPTLAEMLQRPIVAFWTGDDKSGKNRYTISVHTDISDLDEILLNMVLASKVSPSSNRRLSRLYVKQKDVKIKGLHLIVDQPDKQNKGK